MKRVLLLPKCTDDWFLQLVQGSYLDIAIEKQLETSIRCQFGHGEEEQKMEIKKKKQTNGFMNLPNNIIQDKKCKMHMNQRCGLSHLPQYHKINLVDLIKKMILSQAKIDLKRDLENQIERILKDVEGNQMEQ